MIQRRKVSGQIPHRTDGNKEEKGVWKRGREKTLEDMGSGVVRTSHTGKGRLRGWGWWGGNRRHGVV